MVRSRLELPEPQGYFVTPRALGGGSRAWGWRWRKPTIRPGLEQASVVQMTPELVVGVGTRAGLGVGGKRKLDID